MAEVGNDVSFLDIACLLKITPDMTEEKFGGAINASYFDAANLVGTLKQKGLLDIQAGFPGPTSIALTDAAKALLNDINVRSSEPLDALDSEILRQMSGGKRLPFELQSSLNIVPKDLAYRLYKLYKQNLINYVLRNANVELMLTEQGFLKVNAPQTPQPSPQTQTQPQPQVQAQPAQQQAQVGQAGSANPVQAQPQPQAQQAEEIQQLQKDLAKPKPKTKIINIAVLLIAVLVVLFVLFARHII
ncbi:MAG: hypothetical protein ACP5T4_00220 [Candidatus Micrarchaeia archaeon]